MDPAACETNAEEKQILLRLQDSEKELSHRSQTRSFAVQAPLKRKTGSEDEDCSVDERHSILFGYSSSRSSGEVEPEQTSPSDASPDRCWTCFHSCPPLQRPHPVLPLPFSICICPMAAESL